MLRGQEFSGARASERVVGKSGGAPGESGRPPGWSAVHPPGRRHYTLSSE